ncbi:glutamate-rich protein 3 isoform X1, partial [Sesbania bispinosa]
KPLPTARPLTHLVVRLSPPPPQQPQFEAAFCVDITRPTRLLHSRAAPRRSSAPGRPAAAAWT